MPRIPYVYPPTGDPVADKLRERRKEGKLIPLDGVLLNAPPIAAGFSALLGAVRRESSLDAALRELLILRVAALNGAAYEWIAHEPIGRAGGLTDAHLVAIRDISYARPVLVEPRPAPAPALSPVQAAALAYADAMTVSVKVPEEVFNAIKAHVNDREMMEITATVASYNLVSRILTALDVGDMADVEVPQAQNAA